MNMPMFAFHLLKLQVKHGVVLGLLRASIAMAECIDVPASESRWLLKASIQRGTSFAALDAIGIALTRKERRRLFAARVFAQNEKDLRRAIAMLHLRWIERRLAWAKRKGAAA